MVALLAAVLGCGCTGTTLTGYDFETSAAYVAEKSGITLEIKASGHVAPGEDIGRGDVVGTIRLNGVGDAISFRATAGKLTDLVLGSEKVAIADPDGYAVSFVALFESMGYPGADAAEMEELEKVIKGCAGGPKGTIMKGQTTRLRVDKTDFVRR
jgi:hypothetical protein